MRSGRFVCQVTLLSPCWIAVQLPPGNGLPFVPGPAFETALEACAPVATQDPDLQARPFLIACTLSPSPAVTVITPLSLTRRATRRSYLPRRPGRGLPRPRSSAPGEPVPLAQVVLLSRPVCGYHGVSRLEDALRWSPFDPILLGPWTPLRRGFLPVLSASCWWRTPPPRRRESNRS